MSVALDPPVVAPDEIEVVEEPRHVQILRQVRELFSDRKRWTARTSARDRFGNRVRHDDQTAEQWCAVGAARRLAGIGLQSSNLDVDVDHYYAALRLWAEGATGIRHDHEHRCRAEGVIVDTNDSQGYDAVVGALDRALAIYEAGEVSDPT